MSDFELFVTTNMGLITFISAGLCMIGFALIVVSREETKRLGEGAYKSKAAATWSRARIWGWLLFVAFGVTLMVLGFHTVLTLSE